MLSRTTIVFATILLWPVVEAANAQDESTAGRCELKDQHEMVTLLLCPSDLNERQLADEGQVACADQKPCGAWIWHNPEDMPEKAPARHDELTASQVQTARAIWINETEQLIVISKTPSDQ